MTEVLYHVSNNDAPVFVEEAAKRHLLKYLEKEPLCQGVRLSVKKTGCSGLSYVIDYIVTPKPEDIVQPLEAHFNIYIDKASFPFLKGLRMNYISVGMGSKMVFENPNQTGQCGCGESFTVDGI